MVDERGEELLTFETANRRLPSANSLEKHHNAHTIRARNKSGKRVVVEYIHKLYTTYIII